MKRKIVYHAKVVKGKYMKEASKKYVVVFSPSKIRRKLVKNSGQRGYGNSALCKDERKHGRSFLYGKCCVG